MTISFQPTVFVVGVLCPQNQDETPLIQFLEEYWGPCELQSEPYPFDTTTYYCDEMGDELHRFWLVFERLMDASSLVERKLSCMELEKKFSEENHRIFNLDPGYVTGAKFVLASRKNHSHRIYLGSGVFGEVTLMFEQGEWKTTRRTYSDLKGSDHRDWLNHARTFWLKNRSPAAH